MMRTLGIALAALATSAAAWAAEGPRERGEDFDAMWRAVDSQYAYFEASRGSWRRARDTWRPRALSARSRVEFVAVIEGALRTLHDDHVTVSPASVRSPRRVPHDTDLWASWKSGNAVIESVRFAGDADVAGVRPGDTVVKIEGLPVESAVGRWLGEGAATPRARDWALRHLLAGPRAGTFALELGGSEPRHVQIERNGRVPAPMPAVTGRNIGEARDIGYLRLRNLSDSRVLEQLDAGVASLNGARALILDLREAIPGSRHVTRSILARFALREGPWQLREGRDGKRDADRIAAASAPAFGGPLVVLVDRWTAGEAEALAAGLVALSSARLVGTPMAGLRGELRTLRLPHSGLEVRFPAEKVLLPDGPPREALRPAIEVDLAAPGGGPGDPILYQALKLLEK
jgi:carboxyl-terminal processing protease